MSHWDDPNARGPEVVAVDDYDSAVSTHEITIKTPEDYEREMARLNVFLMDNDNPWQSRMACLHRIQTIVTGGVSTKFPNFTAVMVECKKGMANQLSDRRSKVVKETSTALSILTKTVRLLRLSEDDQQQWVGMGQYFLEEMYQTLVQTGVKVICEAGRDGMRDIVDNINDDEAHSMLQTLMSGTAHQHPAVRQTCLECITTLLHKWRLKMKAREKAGEAPPAAAVAADASVLTELSACVCRGIEDSSAPSRSAARQCVIELMDISKAHADGIVAKMDTSAQKALQRDMVHVGGKHTVKTKKPKSKAKRIPLSELRKKHGIKKGEKVEDDVLVAAPSRNGGGAVMEIRVMADQSDKPAEDMAQEEKKGLKVNVSPEKSVSPPRKGSLSGSRKTKAASAADLRVNADEQTPGSSRSSRKVRTPKLAEQYSSPWREKNHSKDLTDALLAAHLEAEEEDHRRWSTGGSTIPPVYEDAFASAMVPDKNRVSAEDSILAESGGTHRRYQCLCKVLDLANPQVTDRMLQFFKQRGTIGMLLSFISRLTTGQVRKLIQKEQELLAKTAQSPRSRAGTTSARLRSPSAALTDGMPLVKKSASAEAFKASAGSSTGPSSFAKSSSMVQIPVDSAAAAPLPSLNEEETKDTVSPLLGNEPNLRERPSTDEEETAIRRSFQAMNLLCANEPRFLALLGQQLDTVVLHLLSAFHETSRANFYHTCKAFSQIVKYFPSEVLDIVLTPEGGCLYRLVFDNLHEPPVGETILVFLAAPAHVKANKDRLFEMLLKDWKVMEVITRRICSPLESEATSSCNALFLKQFMDRMTVHQNSVILISTICAPGALVDSLITTLEQTGTGHDWQRLQCASVLENLLKRSANSQATTVAPLTPGAGMQRPRFVANTFADLFPVLVEKLVPRIKQLCLVLTGTKGEVRVQDGSERRLSGGSSDRMSLSPQKPVVSESSDRLDTTPSPLKNRSSSAPSDDTVRLSAYTVDSTFTRLRLCLINIVGDLCLGSRHVIERIPEEAWRTMVQWFFQYRHNNMYLSAFRTLVVCALRENNAETLRFILDECALVTQMIQFYSNKSHHSCSLHSFILEISNHLRLTADSEKRASSFVPGFLAKHSLWKNFVPVLREETLKQVAKLWNSPRPVNVKKDGFIGTPMPAAGAAAIGGAYAAKPAMAKRASGVLPRSPYGVRGTPRDDPLNQTAPLELPAAMNRAASASADESPPSTPVRVKSPYHRSRTSMDDSSNVIDLGSAYARSLGYGL